MIQEECLVSAWRFSDETGRHPEGTCYILYISPSIVCVKGVVEHMSRANQREFVEMCCAKGIQFIYADLAPNRSLPMARRNNDHQLLTIAELLQRVRMGDQPRQMNGGGHKRRATDV